MHIKINNGNISQSVNVTAPDMVASFLAWGSGTIRVTLGTEFKDVVISERKRYSAVFSGQTLGVKTLNLQSAEIVYVDDVQLEKGNIASDYSPNPEDIEAQITAAQTAANTANNLITDIASDSKITPSEKISLKREYDTIVAEKPTVVEQATPYSVAVAAFNTAYNDLVTYVSPLVANLTTTSDVTGTILRSRFAVYYSEKMKILKEISIKVTGQFATVNGQITAVQSSLSNFQTEVNGAFKDGIISQAEAIAIEKYLNQINTEKDGLQNQYSVVYADAFLTGTPKSDLLAAWNNYVTAHTNLLNSINTAIADGKTTVAEKQDVDVKFTLYRNSLANLSTRLQEALKVIEKGGIDNIQIGGTNLVLNSKKTVSNSGGLTASYLLSQPLQAGEIYTITIKGTFPSGDRPRPHINGIGVEDYGGVGIINNGYYQKTFNYDPRFGNFKVLDIYRLITNSNTVVFDWVKLEKGNKATDWSAAPEDVQAEIDNIQIGGRNYARNGNFKTTQFLQVIQNLTSLNVSNNVLTAIGSNVGYWYHNTLPSIPTTETITISFWVKNNVATQNRLSPTLNGNSTFGDIILGPNQGWTKYEKTGVIGSVTSAPLISLLFENYNAGSFNISIKELKIEKGNKATDWSPAPEDLDAEIALVKSEINDVDNQLTSLTTNFTNFSTDGVINISEAKALKNIAQTLNNEKADVNQKYLQAYNDANLIDKTPLQTAWNSYNSSHDSLLYYINAYTVGNRSISPAELVNVNNAFTNYRNALSALSAALETALKAIATKQIDNIRIGGRNLLLKSNVSFSNFTNDYHIGTYNINQPLSIGETYTLVVHSGNSSSQQINAYVDGYQLIGSLTMVDGGITEITFTVTNTGQPRTLIMFYNMTRTAGVAIYWATLVKGNKGLRDHVPAPEDTAAEIALTKAQATNAQNTAAAAAAVTSFLNTDVNGNVISTGTLQVGSVAGANAGITGVVDRAGASVRIWAGATYAGKNTARWLMRDDGVEEQWINGVLIRQRGVIGGVYAETWFNMNGQLAKKITFTAQGKIQEEWYNNGVLVYQIGQNGIYYVSEIAESYALTRLLNLNSNASTSDGLIFHSTLRQHMFQKSGNPTQFELRGNKDAYLYSAGQNVYSQGNRQYEGYKNNNGDKYTNVPNGWYAVEQLGWMFEDGLEGTTRQVQLMRISNGIVAQNLITNVETQGYYFNQF